MRARTHMVHLVLRNLHHLLALLLVSGVAVRRPARAVHGQRAEEVHEVARAVGSEEAVAEAARLKGVPLTVDANLVGEEHLHHGFALRLLRRALGEQPGAQLVGLVVRVVDVVLPRGVVRAAFDELGGGVSLLWCRREMGTYEFMNVFGLAEKDDVVCSEFQVNDITWSIRGQKRLHNDT